MQHQDFVKYYFKKKKFSLYPAVISNEYFRKCAFNK